MLSLASNQVKEKGASQLVNVDNSNVSEYYIQFWAANSITIIGKGQHSAVSEGRDLN